MLDEDTKAQPQFRRQRQSTQARRIQPGDTELVERVTQALTIVEFVDADPRASAVIEVTARAENVPATIVPGAQRLPILYAAQSPRRGRTWRSGLAMWVGAVVVVLATLAAVAPLAGRLTQHRFEPRGAQVTSNGSPVQLSGPWDSSAGAINYLGDGGGAGPGVRAPGTAGLPVTSQPAATPPSHAPAPTTPPSGISPAPVAPWPPSNAYMFVPGHPGYALAEPNPDPYWWAFGQCTWWAQNQRQDENLKRMGNAQYWAAGAAARGYTVSGAPKAGATVVFQPGVQGAGGAGHVAHVIAVYPYGWFLVSEMNFYWNGGGWGRVDYRFAHSGAGVSFIY